MQPNQTPRPPSPLGAVLFDLDGTLIATRRLMVESFAQALSPYLGYTPSERDIMAKSPRAVRAFLAGEVGASRLSDCLEAFYRAYEGLHAKHFEGIYQGVGDMLTQLRQLGLPIGVVTGKCRRAWGITARHVDLGTMGAWVFDDDVSDIKPNPEGLGLALKSLGVTPQDVIYLGDSLTDCMAARAAGVTPGAVLWSKRVGEIEAFAQGATPLGAKLFATPSHVVDFCRQGKSVE